MAVTLSIDDRFAEDYTQDVVTDIVDALRADPEVACQAFWRAAEVAATAVTALEDLRRGAGGGVLEQHGLSDAMVDWEASARANWDWQADS